MFLSRRELNNKKIARKGKELEPEEVFWDAFIGRKKENVFKRKLEVPLTPAAIFGLQIFFILLAFFVMAKTYRLQIVEHEKYLALAERNKFVVQSLHSQRGVVYDKNFNQIVINKPGFDLVFQRNNYPEDQKEREKILKRIAWILDNDQFALEEKISQTEAQELYIAENLDYRQLILLESNAEELKGFFVRDSGIREYVDGPIFSHILGYYRKTGPGAGLELYYDEQLNPKLGKTVGERDVYGNVLTKKTVSLPEPGNSLVLYLDADLQRNLYQIMEEEMGKAGVEKGIAVAMDPNTGGVLAMVSFPTYDNNLFSYGISQEDWERLSTDQNHPLLNRVISGRYFTGSVIKPLIGSAALQEGVINEDTTVNCKGELVVENPWFEEQPFYYRDWAVHGITNIRKALAQSCNVFFYTVGGGYEKFKGLGADKIKEYLEFFGWNNKLGIDLSGEVAGFIPDREWKKNTFSAPDDIWGPGDTYYLSIGQGYLTATPLEVNSSIAAIVNGGILYKPRIVQKIIDANKEVVEEFMPEIIRQGFIDRENLEIIRLGMKDGVEYGSSVALKNLPVSAGAKTGTAEIGKKDHYHNWISVFAPYEEPEIVVTIMVEDVEGLRVAVIPTVRRTLEWYFGGRNSIIETETEE
jgi:penicillin-binding protein 2